MERMVFSKINIQSASSGVELQDAEFIRATGDIHPVFWKIARVVRGRFIYLMGGMADSELDTNVLTKLSSSGKFEELQPIREIPKTIWSSRVVL